MGLFDRKVVRQSSRGRVAAWAAGMALAAATTALPSAAEASFAQQLGTKYGGKLSRNPSLRTQALTADPEGVIEGSVSLRYDPAAVTLQGFLDGTEFDVTAAYVGVTFPGNTSPNGQVLLTAQQFFQERTALPYAVTETGFVQVVYTRTDGLFDDDFSDVAEPDGYDFLASGGFTAGDETHGYLFGEVDGAPTTGVPLYRLYDDDGEFGQFADYLLVDVDGEGTADPVRFTDVEDAVIPEPSTTSLALAAAGLAALRRRQRRRHITR